MLEVAAVAVLIGVRKSYDVAYLCSGGLLSNSPPASSSILGYR